MVFGGGCHGGFSPCDDRCLFRLVLVLFFVVEESHFLEIFNRIGLGHLLLRVEMAKKSQLTIQREVQKSHEHQQKAYQYPIGNIVIIRLRKLLLLKRLLHRQSHRSLVQKPPTQQQHQIINLPHHRRRRLMYRHDHRSSRLRNPPQHLHQTLRRIRIQPARGLVEHEQTGIRHEFHSALYALLFSPAEASRHEDSAADERVGDVLQPEVVEYVVDDVGDFGVG
mmetsp:Transcript_27273/g.49536  ORF Transcript_27273/g.49536 Transcript_27273/m.49536 type:complete len:223 (-) Transcript_27273:1024-1692(-)